MSDRLHDHDTIGLRRGCVACAQTEADFARCVRANRSTSPADPTPEPALAGSAGATERA